MAGASERALAHDPSFAIVTTANVTPYLQAAAAVRKGVEERFPSVPAPIILEKENPSNLPALPSDSDDVIVGVGSAAVQTLMQGKSSAQLVGCMTLAAHTGNSGKLSASVLMEFSPELRLDWIHKLLPNARTVGLVYAEAESAGRPEAFATAVRKTGLKLNTYAVQNAAELAAVIDRASGENDVLIPLADALLMAPQSAKQLLLASFRNRVPVIGLSEPWAKAGALFALDWDFEDIGRQCAQLALKVASSPRGTVQPSATPRKTRLVVNIRTARYLKVNIPDSLLQQAAEVFQ